MKQIEQHYGINLFDRFNMAYRDGEQVLAAPRHEFEELLRSGKINAQTIVFNNLVQDLQQLETRWEVPYNESWHPQLFGVLSH